MKKITIRETAGLARCNEIVRVSVPCARGDFAADTTVAVVGPDGQMQPCQSRVLNQWPDGSAKWLLIDVAVSVTAGGGAEYFLAPAGHVPPVTNQVQVQQRTDSWQVDTGRATFSVDARIFRPFSRVTVGGRDVLRSAESACVLGLDGHADAVAVIENIALEEAGPLRAVVRVAGRYDGASVPAVRFFCRLHFLADSSAVSIEYTMHNPAAARHSGGLWDLGDQGSLLFRSLMFSFCTQDAATEIFCIPHPSALPLVIPGSSQLSLYQESSGGENWRSHVHRNREGNVPMQQNGYCVEIDSQEVATGQRSTPVVWYGTGAEGIAVTVPYFWQEFPGELAVADCCLQVILFPKRFPDLHEVQGGEQKTYEFRIDFAIERERLGWSCHPLAAQASPDVYLESGIFHDLPGDIDLVDSFASPKSMIDKREKADEYGWRNFGEIYADHEALYHQGNDTFVSHYNNQYDFIAGLYRKSFATGDPGWRELAGDLSRHVRDIDLYHTDGDREEYSHGLFWHTDHYVDAGLSAHRSFSRQHLQMKPPHLCGGGPGAEHCYTTGLMLHYFQTGNTDFKDAVISLAEWELLALAGPQTLLAALKRAVGHINLWRYSKGQGGLFPRYPLTRGTGNAITACLDAFEVSGDRSYLAKAEELIRGALHPEDDIVARNLLDAEVAWSYTVLLTAVAKFLDKKSEMGEIDAGFAHARASLLVYAEWMLANEYPYLDKPEILEYPNETWAAQDLRKSVILYQAARYAASRQQQNVLFEKAKFFYVSASAKLRKHQSSSFSRPIVLMLQNGWVGSRLDEQFVADSVACEAVRPVPGPATPHITLGAVIMRIFADIIAVLGQTSVSREIAWFRARISN